MSARKDIEKMIDRKRQEIAELRRTIEHAETYIQALQDTLKKLPTDPADDPTKQVVLRADSDLWHVQEILRKAGKPLHIDEIIPELSKAVNKTFTGTKRNGLIGSLGSYARRQKVFTRPRPNIFSLIERTIEILDDKREEIKNLPSAATME
jgi:hypothetical protein